MTSAANRVEQAARRRLFAARDVTLAGLFGALAMALPLAFHAVPGAGPIWQPMYLPLLALGLLVSWETALVAGALVPMVSALVTGMPPLVPPVALLMAAELAALAGGASLARRLGLGLWPATLVGQVAARLAGVVALVTIGRALGIERGVWEYAVLSLAVAWPGLLLQWLVVPSVVATIERASLLGARWREDQR